MLIYFTLKYTSILHTLFIVHKLKVYIRVKQMNIVLLPVAVLRTINGRPPYLSPSLPPSLLHSLPQLGLAGVL